VEDRPPASRSLTGSTQNVPGNIMRLHKADLVYLLAFAIAVHYRITISDWLAAHLPL
jgi:hypothetical protein